MQREGFLLQSECSTLVFIERKKFTFLFNVIFFPAILLLCLSRGGEFNVEEEKTKVDGNIEASFLQGSMKTEKIATFRYRLYTPSNPTEEMPQLQFLMMQIIFPFQDMLTWIKR